MNGPDPTGRKLAGQTVVVLGGTAGIGLATARRAREEGAKLILTARDPDRLHRVGLELKASIAAFDLSDPDRLIGFFTHLPGLKVVLPSSPYEAKGLLIQSIRDNDPVIFCEHKAMYDVTGDVPEESYTIPFGEANVVRDGDDVTIVALGRMVSFAQQAADQLESSGVSAEVIDPRTVSPLDLDTILESVENTGRLVVVDEASPRCNLATDISAQVVSEAFGDLKAPIKMVSPPHVPVPFAGPLEDLYIPSVQDIVNAAKTVAEWSK